MSLRTSACPSGVRESCGKELWETLGRSSSDHIFIRIYAAKPKR